MTGVDITKRALTHIQHLDSPLIPLMTQMIENARSDSVKPQLDEILIKPLRYCELLMGINDDGS